MEIRTENEASGENQLISARQRQKLSYRVYIYTAVLLTSSVSNLVAYPEFLVIICCQLLFSISIVNLWLRSLHAIQISRPESSPLIIEIYIEAASHLEICFASTGTIIAIVVISIILSYLFIGYQYFHQYYNYSHTL